MFLRMIRWLRSLYRRQIWMRFFGLLGPAPFFVASLFCFEAKRKSGWGICGSFLVVLLFFVWFCFRDDLPKFLDHTCPCTLLLFTAYAIVRTEPSATSAKPEEKKINRKSLTHRYHYALMMSIIFHAMKTTCKSTSALELGKPQLP